MTFLTLLMLDFDQWKAKFEQETNTSFIKATGKKVKSGRGITYYYYCNRSGYFKPSGHNVRALKSKVNPVLLYRTQGQNEFSECPSLKRDDFMLAIQTPNQKQLLQKFGSNIVYMHG